MATMTLSTHREQPTNRSLHGLRAKIDAFVRASMQHAVAEGSRARLFGWPKPENLGTRNPDDGELVARLKPRSAPSLGRKIARFMLTASLAFVALAGTVALQAAIHVYVWRLAG